MSDERLRQLERAAASGDADAVERRNHERRRNNHCVRCGATSDLVDPPTPPGFLKRALWKAMGVPYEPVVYEPKCATCVSVVKISRMAGALSAALKIYGGDFGDVRVSEAAAESPMLPSLMSHYDNYAGMDEFTEVILDE